jgi:hypothetical protein
LLGLHSQSLIIFTVFIVVFSKIINLLSIFNKSLLSLWISYGQKEADSLSLRNSKFGSSETGESFNQLGVSILLVLSLVVC